MISPGAWQIRWEIQVMRSRARTGHKIELVVAYVEYTSTEQLCLLRRYLSDHGVL